MLTKEITIIKKVEESDDFTYILQEEIDYPGTIALLEVTGRKDLDNIIEREYGLSQTTKGVENFRESFTNLPTAEIRLDPILDGASAEPFYCEGGVYKNAQEVIDMLNSMLRAKTYAPNGLGNSWGHYFEFILPPPGDVYVGVLRNLVGQAHVNIILIQKDASLGDGSGSYIRIYKTTHIRSLFTGQNPGSFPPTGRALLVPVVITNSDVEDYLDYYRIKTYPSCITHEDDLNNFFAWGFHWFPSGLNPAMWEKKTVIDYDEKIELKKNVVDPNKYCDNLSAICVYMYEPDLEYDDDFLEIYPEASDIGLMGFISLDQQERGVFKSVVFNPTKKIFNPNLTKISNLKLKVFGLAKDTGSWFKISFFKDSLFDYITFKFIITF